MAHIQISEAAKKAALDLHAFCKSIHPAVSDKIDLAFNRAEKPGEKEKWRRLLVFLEKQKLDRLASDSEPEKMDGLKSNLLRLAREFEQARHKPAPPYIGLFGILKSRLDENGQISFFFNKAGKEDAEYSEILFNVSKKQTGKGFALPQTSQEKHDLTYGDMSSLDAWLKTPASCDLKMCEARLRAAVNDNHIQVINHLLAHLKNRLIPQDSLHELMNYLKHDYNQTTGVPLCYPPLLTQDEKDETRIYRRLAARLNLPSDFTLGLGVLDRSGERAKSLDRETYKKIRNFLAYEITSLYDLNHVSLMATLLFPVYNDFIAYVTKRAKLDPETGTLRLADLLDDSNFVFADMDYQAWGQALIQQLDDVFFYFKCADVLEETPKDKQGRVLVSAVRDMLYDHIEYCMEKLDAYDIERCELPLIAELKEIKSLLERYGHLPDKIKNIPDSVIEGERFGKHGWKFKRLSFNDLRLFILGRLTGNCERINGMWADSIINAYTTRLSGFYVLVDHTDTIMAHSNVYRDEGIETIIYAGFEADQEEEEIDANLLSSIVELIKLDSQLKVKVGPSSRHLNMNADFHPNIFNLQVADGFKYEMPPVLDIDVLMENANISGPTPIRQIDPSEKDSEELKAARQSFFVPKPKSP